MSVNHNDQQLAEIMLGEVPLDYKRYPDGSLVVIASSGRKIRYSPEAIAVAQVKAPAKPVSKSPTKSPVQRAPKTSANKG